MGGFTIWQGLGIVVGAIAGFYTGGAGWALAGNIIMGASIGYGLGTMVDPNIPDIPQAGEPAMSELDIPTIEEGLLIPDFLGTERMAGNITWYDGARSVEVKEKQDSGGKGGGGGSKKVVVGYKYYLSWEVALAQGPVDALLAVWKNDEAIWSGELTDDGSGYGTITLKDMGSCTFSFGTTNQPRIAAIGNYVGAANNSPYRGVAKAFMNDCLLGSYNRAPALLFVMRKTPEFSWSKYNRIGLYDYNAIHACYYVLSTLAGLPDAWFDEPAIASAASLAASVNEGHGLSILFSSQRSAQQYLETIMSHIGGIMRYSNESKFIFELMRATIAATSLQEITDADFVEEPIIVRKTWLDIASEIKIQHHVRYDGGEAEGRPDIYSIVFIDESMTAPSQYIATTTSPWNPGTGWAADYAAAQVSPKPGQLGDSRWFGMVGHILDNGGYDKIIPGTYSKSTVAAAIGLAGDGFFTIPYSGSTGYEGRDFLAAVIAANGWRPGSWFVFTRDITGSNDANQLAVGAEQVANMKAWLVANYPAHYIYSHDETAGDERWMNWIITNVTL